MVATHAYLGVTLADVLESRRWQGRVPVLRQHVRLFDVMVTEAVDIHSRQSARVAKAAAVWVVAIAIAQPLTWLLRFFVLPIDPGRATYALAARML